MKLLNFFKKDNRSIADICKRAMNSFSFNYHLVSNSNETTQEVSFAEAIKSIPNDEVNFCEIDFYA